MGMRIENKDMKLGCGLLFLMVILLVLGSFFGGKYELGFRWIIIPAPIIGIFAFGIMAIFTQKENEDIPYVLVWVAGPIVGALVAVVFYFVGKIFF